MFRWKNDQSWLFHACNDHEYSWETGGREGEVLNEMFRRGAKRLVLVSCSDDKDDAWIEQYAPKVVIVNEQAPDRHNWISGIFGSRFKSRWYGPVGAQ